MAHPYDPVHWCPRCHGDDAKDCPNYGKRKYRVKKEKKRKRSAMERVLDFILGEGNF
jgi:hypothetical protein